MPKVTDEPLTRVHIQLYEADWQALLVFFGSSVKRSAVIRDIVRDFVQHTKVKAERRAQNAQRGKEQLGERNKQPA